MADIGKVLEGLAVLLWPIIVIILIFAFKPAIAAIVDSAKSRKFTLKIGGQELTMEEANQQQQIAIDDLRKNLSELKSAVESSKQYEQAVKEQGSVESLIKDTAILWVDDNPKNNIFLIQQLRNMGFKVELSLSTEDGLAKFHDGNYALIISDIGRKERGGYNYSAGFDLLKGIREQNSNFPFVIFSTFRAIQQYGTRIQALGVTAMTNSPTELLGIIRSEISKLRAK